MLKTYILKINRNLENDDFDRLLSYVSEEKKEQIIRYHLFEDAQRSLLGDILSRYAICKELDVKNRDLTFRTNKYGKPELFEPHRLHFNISHSGNWVVCAIDDNPVGIDVEVIRSIDYNIAEAFFSEDEYNSLINQPENMRVRYFYMLWTLKECYIKAEGKGLSIPLNSFNISINGSNTNITTDSKNMVYNFYQYFLQDNSLLAVCTLSTTNFKINFELKQFIEQTFCMI